MLIERGTTPVLEDDTAAAVIDISEAYKERYRLF